MNVNRKMAIALIGSIMTIALATSSLATPKQYKAGYAAGVAIGREMGKADGSGEAGTNSMHTNATCSIEHPKNKDFDRGYDKGCRITYEKTFEQAYKNRKKKRSN
jgi:hypothetical protein